MKLSKDISLHTYTYFTHPIFGFVIPVLFGLIFSLFLDTLVADMSLFSPGVVVVILLGPLLQIVSIFKFHPFDFKLEERIGEIALFLLILYGIFGFFKSGSLADRLAIQGWDLYYLVSALMSWFISIFFYKLFKAKEKYLSEQARSEDPKNRNNTDLHKMVDVFSMEAYNSTKYITTTLAVLALFAAFMFLFVDFFGRDFPPAGPIIALILLFAGTLLYLHEKIFLEMKTLLADKIHVPEQVKNNRFALGVGLITVCIALGLAAAGDSSLFNLFSLIDFVLPEASNNQRWSRVIAEAEKSTINKPAEAPEFGQIEQIIDLSVFNDLLMIILPISIILLVGFIVFKSIKAALNKRKNNTEKKLTVFEAIGDLFIRIGEFFASLFSEDNNIITIFSENKKQQVEKQNSYQLFDKKDTVKKQEEKHMLVRELHKVFKWGKKRKLPYYSSDTLTDYILKVRETFPSLSDKLTKLTGIFNEGMFSQKTLPQDKITLYRSLVKDIISIHG